MSWTVYSSLILLTLIITCIYLPLSIIYYHRIIKPNAKLPVFRVRRPKFIFYFLIIIITNNILRSTLAFLTSINFIQNTIFSSILYSVSTYYGSIPIVCIRVWLLYYDMRSAQKQREYMLSKHLNTTEDIMAQQTKPSLKAIQMSIRKSFRINGNRKTVTIHRNILNKYKPLSCIAYGITTVLFIIYLSLFFTHSEQASRVCIIYHR